MSYVTQLVEEAEMVSREMINVAMTRQVRTSINKSTHIHAYRIAA